jgi:putative transposase
MAQQTVAKGVSIRLACLAFGICQTSFRCQAKQSAENVEIADLLIRLTHSQRNWGFGLCFLYLRNVKGHRWNHKRVYRIYRELELNLRIKPRKRIVREKPEPLAVLEAINQRWSMDFMHDQLSDGRSYRLFNVIDDFNREALAIDIDLSLPSERVIRSLDQIIEWRGNPQVIRSDNGPEYISGTFIAWAAQQGIRLDHIQPGNPSRTPISNATTARSATTGSAITCLSRLRRYRTMRPTGCGPTITNAPTWRSAALPRSRSQHS